MSGAVQMPTVYLTHGGGPCFWMEFPPPFGPQAYEGLRAYLAGLLASLPAAPRAIVMVSAHWEEAVPTVSTAPFPPMLFDYYGFPPHTYRLSYPAPGSPGLAERVRGLLEATGIETAANAERGFDHGVFVPMLIIDPATRIPVVMLSLAADLDPARHLAIGAALARCAPSRSSSSAAAAATTTCARSSPAARADPARSTRGWSKRPPHSSRSRAATGCSSGARRRTPSPLIRAPNTSSR